CGYRPRVLTVQNNLSLMYWRLGLYGKAQAYAKAVVDQVRRLNSPAVLSSFVETLARPMIDSGRYDEAQRLLEEGVALSQSVDSQLNEGYNRLGLGMVALAEGKSHEARWQFETAAQLLQVGTTPGDQITALAWLGAADLAVGDWKAADEHTAQAAQDLAANPAFSPEYPFQGVWWWRYQVLQQSPKRSGGGRQHPSKAKRVKDEAWTCLNRAYETMMDSVATLSDEGLRRNFLNKVSINRQILLAWTQEATARGMAVAESQALEGNLQDQLRRMMEISVRMNEQREPEALLEFIMDEAVELNGAERSMLVLSNAEGQLDFRIARGVGADDLEDVRTSATRMLAHVSRSRQAVLDADEHDGNAPGEPPGRWRSRIAAPLIARGQMIGLLYADNRAIFGPFRQADVELLSLFANQAATALDNAKLYHGLEQRVTERTAELLASNAALEQRNAELSIISSVQQGLAKELDLQAIVNVVGDKIRATLGGQNCLIVLYDKATSLLSFPYWVGDKGEPVHQQPVPLGAGLTSIVIKTRQPLVLGTAEEGRALGAVIVDDGVAEMPESWMGVPMLAGTEVVGAVVVQDWTKNRYSQDDVRLASTLASSLAVALQNARLFAETKRLLKETDQRAAELAIINSIQEGLASKLEVQAIYDLVGDKIRDIFDAQSVGINTYDWTTGMSCPRYAIERGKRVSDEPRALRPGGLDDYLRRTRQPMLINRNAQERAAEFGLTVHPGTEMPKSLLFVPLIVGDEVLGVIDLQNLDRENAFSDSDVSLLTTLA
ncbi:MAG: GAF domain-containing protein, partial [Chloroflexi bacterium]|nr:GAF domain-containing protein [Chloroflexota bacterium]